MKLTTLLLTLLLSISFATTACADFQSGLDAYDNGKYKTALREWQVLAEKGDAKAQFNLGLMYAKGQGVVQDYTEAVKWYKKAAKQGDADAQFALGVMYKYGDGVLKDMTKAKYWIKKAYENLDTFVRKKAKEFWEEYELWKY